MAESLIREQPLVELKRSNFAAESIHVRAHLKAAFRDHMDLIDENLHVVAEEFGDFDEEMAVCHLWLVGLRKPKALRPWCLARRL